MDLIVELSKRTSTCEGSTVMFYSARGGIVVYSNITLQIKNIFRFSKSEMSVVVGSSDGVDGKTYSIKKIVHHPDYDKYSYSYNYALIKIKGKFTWSDKVANVSLPSAEPQTNTSFVVAGYGDTEPVSTPYLHTCAKSRLKASTLYIFSYPLRKRGGGGLVRYYLF